MGYYKSFDEAMALWRVACIVRARLSCGLMTASGDDDRATDDSIAARVSLLQDSATTFKAYTEIG